MSKRTWDSFVPCQDQILGKKQYSDPQDQSLYNEHTWSLCSTAALNAWDKIQELGKRIESYVRVEQGPEKTLQWLQILTKTEHIRVTDPEVLIGFWLLKMITYNARRSFGV